MRLKNVKNASDIINSSNYVVREPNTCKGNWNKVFDNLNPICIEIGMGKGDFIIGMAKKFPNINVLESRISRLENPYQNNIQNFGQQNQIPSYQTTQNNAGYNGEMYMM